jgi:hypothetical protein
LIKHRKRRGIQRVQTHKPLITEGRALYHKLSRKCCQNAAEMSRNPVLVADIA